MNILIYLNDVDVTNDCRLQDTRINFDSSRRITTASLTIMAQATRAVSRYGEAFYDESKYSVDLKELYEVRIHDAGTGRKLFHGQIYSLELEQTDAPGIEVFFHCELNDWAAFLDRSVCWGGYTLPLPASDKQIITNLLTQFCPKITLASIQEIIPVIMDYDWANKTCRQVLDDICALSMGEWQIDMDARLSYRPAASAPQAPYSLSTDPDYVTSFPVKVEGYRSDFSNPINRCYVRGGWEPSTGFLIDASYTDPVSVAMYGEYATSMVDEQIITAWDAQLKAKSTVLQYAYPIETGNFTCWGTDWLECGMQVHLTEHTLSIDGDYIVRAVSMQWEDQWVVRYEAQFGHAQPDLETIFRILEQRTRWKTSNKATANVAPGSITDGDIAPPGLGAGSINKVNTSAFVGLIEAGQIHEVQATTIIGQIVAGQIKTVSAGAVVGVLQADQIETVNAHSIQGQIQAEQIQTVNADSIQGQVEAGQIGTVNADAIQGQIEAGQIHTINATSIQGVVVSSQLADKIIDDLAKYADATRPIPTVRDTATDIGALPNDNFPPGSYFFYEPDGKFYKIDPSGTYWTGPYDSVSGHLKLYHIGTISATSITGLIVAAQIQTVRADSITGAVQAEQIGSVYATAVTGKLNAGQIQTITAGQITGKLEAGQINTVNASSISGQLTAGQIQTVNAQSIQGVIDASHIGIINASNVTGTFAYTQIGSVNASTITIGLLDTDNRISRISGGKLDVGSINSDKLNATEISVGGGGSKPGKLVVYDGSGNNIAQLGFMSSGAYGGWFKVFGAGGSSYSDAKVYTNTVGNLFVRDADFQITSGAYKVHSSPSTFDTSYSTLAWKVSNSTDSTSHISRGIVCYNGSQQVAAMVRSPTMATAGEVVVYKGGIIIFHADGPNDRVRVFVGGALRTIIVDGNGFLKAG